MKPFFHLSFFFFVFSPILLMEKVFYYSCSRHPPTTLPIQATNEETDACSRPLCIYTLKFLAYKKGQKHDFFCPQEVEKNALKSCS